MWLNKKEEKVKKLAEFFSTIPLRECVLDDGICEFVIPDEPPENSLGISYESGLGDNEDETRYICNVFRGDVYINIGGTYTAEELRTDTRLYEEIADALLSEVL